MIILKWIIYKLVTVKWLRVEEGGAAFDVGCTELYCKHRVGQTEMRAGGGAICWALREADVGPRAKASIYRRQISAFSRLLQKLTVAQLLRTFLVIRVPAGDRSWFFS